MQENSVCKNCSNHFTGKFCNQCGEKIYNEKDKLIKHLFNDAVHFISHFDGTFLTSLKTAITKPGKISLDYCSGIRKKYFKPVPFFLLLVVFYLLFPRFQGLNMSAGTYASPQYGFTWLTIPMFKAKMKNHHVDFAEIAKRYDEKSPKVAKISLLLFIPLTSGVIGLLFINKRRPFFDHFILSTELLSFFIFLDFLVLPFLSFLVEKIAPQYNPVFYDGSWVDWMTQSIFGLFIIIAFRRFYKEAQWISITKGFTFFIIFFVGIRYIYSLIVFLLTMIFV